VLDAGRGLVELGVEARLRGVVDGLGVDASVDEPATTLGAAGGPECPQAAVTASRHTTTAAAVTRRRSNRGCIRPP